MPGVVTHDLSGSWLRERAALSGMMLHQDGSTHAWVPGQFVAMDAATSEHYSMFFVAQEGTSSSFRGVRETVLARGLFCSLYTDRGSHYCLTPEVGGEADKTRLTQFGRAMHQLGDGEWGQAPAEPVPGGGG